MSTILERLEYGYDRDSRRTWRRRALATGEDNHYGYDGLKQVTNAALGSLNLNVTAIGGVPREAQAWNYDPTGNWRGYQTMANGSVVLDQSRVHDKGNRLTQIEGAPNPVLLDRAGRMREVAPDAGGNWNESLEVKWDAWSRVTQVRRKSDGTVLGSYSYDGLTRRLTQSVGSTTTRTYYSDAWRPLEERRDGQTTAARHYYWGARHRDDLVRRDRATTSGGSLNEVRYVLIDYFSPAAITDGSGNVTERYSFSAFGVRRILTPAFTDRATSECDFTFGFQGQFLDNESGFLNYGYRYYSPPLGRWLSKDPIQERGGSNVYTFAGNTANQLDVLGLLSVTLEGDGEPSEPNVVGGRGRYQLGWVQPSGSASCSVQKDKKCWKVKCTITLKGLDTVYYNENYSGNFGDKAKKFRRHSGSGEYTVFEGVVGHEQRHLKAFREEAKRIKTELEKEKDCFESEQDAKTAIEQYQQDTNCKLQAALQGQVDHQTPEPAAGMLYPPLKPLFP